MSHDFDTTQGQGSDVKENVKNIFGVEFSENQDWKTAFSSSVSVRVNPGDGVNKIQIMALIKEDDENQCLKVLNEFNLTGETFVKLNYDAPKDNLGLYVAYITSSGSYHL